MVSDEDFLKNYDVSGIRHEKCSTQRKRRNLLYTIIEKNPGIRHNPILRIVVKIFSAMAKKTAERELKHLEEEGLVLVTKEGYNYKYYEIRPRFAEVEMKEGLESVLDDVSKAIEIIQKKYSTLSNRDEIIALLLHYMYSVYPMVVLADNITTYSGFKKQKIRFEKLIQKTYNIINKESADGFFIFMCLNSIMKKEGIENELESKFEKM